MLTSKTLSGEEMSPLSPKLLFVDSDPLVLEGFRRLVSLHAPHWDAQYILASDAPESALDDQAPDILITDFSLDSPFLLNRAAETHPKTIRIALVAHYTGDHVHAAIRSAHLVLAKPCDSRQLIHHIEMTLDMQRALESAELRELVSSVGRLPSPPDIYLKVQDLINSGRASAQALAQTIEQDPVLCAKLLQVANSAIFALREPVANVLTAIRIFGFEGIRGLIITQAITRQVEDQDFAKGYDLNLTWQHSFVAASLGRKIAQDENQSTTVADHAFLAGLLHDIGTVVFAMGLPDRYAELLAESESTGQYIANIELESFGVHHGHVGAYLLSLWGLPQDVITSVAGHHDDVSELLEFADVIGAPEIVAGVELTLRNLNQEAKGNVMTQKTLSRRLRNWRKLAHKALIAQR